MTTLIGHIPTLDGTYEITIRNKTIASLTPSDQQTDLCIGPTLFDIQVNGYGGRTCRIASPDKQDALAYITQLLRENGVGWWLPTITTASAAALEAAFKGCAQALDEDADTAASIPGLHLEGPYISPVEGPRGAHPLEHVRPPDWEEFCRLQELSGGRIRLVTIAPEADGAVAFTKRCVQSGVAVAMGHTNLDRDALQRAVDAGATLSTHLGNGAHDQVQRHNNYLWYQLAERRAFASFISDGQHLPQECLYAMIHAKGLERSVLISDAVLLGGMKPGVYQMGDRSIEMLPSGRIVIPGTPNLAGSASNLRECVEIAQDWAHLTHAQAWALASLNPARLLGLENRLSLQVGGEASLTVYRQTTDTNGTHLAIAATWVAGRQVFDAHTQTLSAMPDQPEDASSPI
jgi:N-acetylglucosamine-6-phosphate deacetylase